MISAGERNCWQRDLKPGGATRLKAQEDRGRRRTWNIFSGVLINWEEVEEGEEEGVEESDHPQPDDVLIGKEIKATNFELWSIFQRAVILGVGDERDAVGEEELT